MGLFLGSLSCSIDLCFCFYASTRLFWWLWPYSTILLPTFPIVYSISPRLFCNYPSILLDPFTSFHPIPQPLSSLATISPFSVSKTSCVLSVHLHCTLDSTYKRDHVVLSFFDWLISLRLTPGRTFSTQRVDTHFKVNMRMSSNDRSDPRELQQIWPRFPTALHFN